MTVQKNGQNIFKKPGTNKQECGKLPWDTTIKTCGKYRSDQDIQTRIGTILLYYTIQANDNNLPQVNQKRFHQDTLEPHIGNDQEASRKIK